MDGAMTKAPLGGKRNRSQSYGPGQKRDQTKPAPFPKGGLLTEGHGIPIAVVVDGANRHDMKLLEPTLQATVIQSPIITAQQPQNLCLDKGYDYPEVRELVAAWGYTGHIRSRGEEQADKGTIPGYRARRWPPSQKGAG